MHCETILRKGEMPQAFNNFLAWVGGTSSGEGDHPKLLPQAKFKRFNQLLTTPIDTVELCDAMFTKLNRVFDAEDARRELKFNKDGLDDDFNDYYDSFKYWATKGAEAVKTSINSVWVVDLPETQVSEFPEPYGYLVNISQVIDLYNDTSNNCIWLLFKSGDYLLVYDDESIRKFEYKDGELGEEVGQFVHELGYTPARMMWSDRLMQYDSINKKSPVTNVLTSLDNWLFMSVNKKYMDLGNSYPITAAYESGADVSQDNKQDNKSPNTKAPSGADLLGPGSYIELPAPLPGEVNLMDNPIQVISPDVTSLEYHSEMLERKKDQIFENVVGREDDRNNDQAKNEAQVQSAVESREEVLSRYSVNWEEIDKFSTTVMAQLRYGSSFISYDCDYGTQWFLRSLNDLQEDYKMALDTGADPVILEEIKNAIINLKYRNNPTGKVRADLITDLTPYRDKSVDDLIMLSKEGLVDEIDLRIRLNLLDFIARFERENAPLNVFGRDVDYTVKLRNIREALEGYAQEVVESQKKIDPPDDPEDNN